MTILRTFFTVLALAACTTASVHAADLPPTPQDPQLAAAFVQAQALLEKSGSGGYLDLPDNAKPWPCAVTELQLRKYAYALSDNEQDEKTRKLMGNIYRDAGMNRKDLKTTIRDARHAPVYAACKDGKLDGPLEFIIEYTRSIDMPTAISETRSRSHIRLTVSAGEPLTETPYTVTTLQLSNKTSYKDPAIQTMMEKHKPPETTVITASYTQPVNPDAGYSAIIIETRTGLFTREWMTMLNRPTAPKRMENNTYRGASLWMVSHTKNGRNHGEYRTYPAIFNGVTVPGTSRCYEDGDEIKTTQCDVD